MELSDKDIKRLSVMLLVLLLTVLVFILVKPIALSIIGGLILAYAFSPVYNGVLRVIKNRRVAAILVSILVLIIIILPIYFLTPPLFSQIFGLFETAQRLDIKGFLQFIMPAATEPFLVQATVTINTIISNLSSTILNFLIGFLLEFPTLMFHFLILAFVFFYSLKDSDKLTEFVADLSPLNKTQEQKFTKQFRDITNSIVYGQVVIGIVQGAGAGLGFFLFGIPNALILTVLAVGMSVIPLLGPFFVWVPALIFLFLEGNTSIAVMFLLYNLILVSNIDNILRLYLVSRKTEMSQAIIMIGMIGGLIIFGILGLILGPLLMAYFITFLKLYKANTLSSLFKTES